MPNEKVPKDNIDIRIDKDDFDGRSDGSASSRQTIDSSKSKVKFKNAVYQVKYQWKTKHFHSTMILFFYYKFLCSF